MIFGMRPQELAALIALLFAGTIVLVPVLALSARFALKPVIEAIARLKQSGSDATLQDRRIALLEAEVQHLGAAVQQFAEVEDFRRQLGVPSPPAVEHRA
jgi:hypothetical protein